MPQSILDRLVQIKKYNKTTERIVFVDDVSRTVLRRVMFESLEGDTFYFGELEPFPYSHHIN